jgi:hypothetical protein
MLQSLLQSSTGYTMNSFYLLGINEHHTFHTHALMVYFKLCSTKNMHNIQICYINIINVSVAIVTTIRVHVGIQNINNIWQSVCYYSAFVGVLYELQYSFNAQISNILRRSSFTPSYLPPLRNRVCNGSSSLNCVETKRVQLRTQIKFVFFGEDPRFLYATNLLCSFQDRPLRRRFFFSTSVVLISYFLQENRIAYFITVYVICTMHIP